MKVCSKCEKNLHDGMFFKCSKSKSGLQSQCKSCKVSSVRSAPSQSKENRRSAELNRKTPENRKKRRDYHHKTKVARNISRRMRHSLNGSQKSKSWELLVDFSLEELKIHLETRFRDGMTWENYGHFWHIDHIHPISKFRITSEDCADFKNCWSLENLQPLLAIENLSKGNKILYSTNG